MIAAGHPRTAQAGAEILRAGGNAVDAAVAAVAASLICESTLTGLGAGGFMLVSIDGEVRLLDFFVAAPGLGGSARRARLVPIDVAFDAATSQRFHIGEASCAVPGVPAGLDEATRRFGTLPLRTLFEPAIRLARDGVELNRQQAYLNEILAPILLHDGNARSVYCDRAGGNLVGVGGVIRWEALAVELERLGSDGAEDYYRGERARQIAARVAAAGGELAVEDLAAYRAIEREPVRAGYADCEVLTNPPPSAGGVLIALALDLLEQIGDGAAPSPDRLVAVMEATQSARSEGFQRGLVRPGFAAEFLSAAAVERLADPLRRGLRPGQPGDDGPADRLGSTTHISVIDGAGNAASVTCSNGSGSGVFVPGTAIHLNNMLGEQDLNPYGFHRLGAGSRPQSMMAPTIVRRDGEVVAALGSGGSNRIRSAILQLVVALLSSQAEVADAVAAPRLHFEDDEVHAEPGIDPAALSRLSHNGYKIRAWEAHNLYFGGVHAVTRDPASGELAGGGDPRRGGAVVVV